MQFQADILGIPVVRPANTETTAAGAAFLAGLAVDFWPSVAALGEMWRREQTFEPSMNESRRRALVEGWTRAVRRAAGWIQQPDQ
jgi:glycerol kinase